MKTKKPTPRRFVASGVTNIQRLVEGHSGAKKTDTLFVLVKRNGRRFRRSLETSDLPEARRRAKVIIEMIKAEKWNELQGVKTRAGWAPLDLVYKTYLETATIKTKKRAVKMLEHLLRVAGKDPQGPSTQLGAHTVWQFQQNMVKAAGSDFVAQARAMVSANSILRQARSVFAEHILPAYKDLTLPALKDFLKCPKLKAPRAQYVAPPGAVLDRIGKEYPELKRQDPGAYAAFLLGAFLGLRNNEVAAAEWAWIEADTNGRSWLRLATRPHWRTKTKTNRDVEVPPVVLADLLELRGAVVEGIAGDPVYLVPAHHKTERTNRVFRRLNLWLRGRGLRKENFAKGFYELRKYFINRLAWSDGAYQAARKGGNSPAVVERFYSDAGGRAPLEIPAPAGAAAGLVENTPQGIENAGI